jgi:hypothetical protein
MYILYEKRWAIRRRHICRRAVSALEIRLPGGGLSYPSTGNGINFEQCVMFDPARRLFRGRKYTGARGDGQ